MNRSWEVVERTAVERTAVERTAVERTAVLLRPGTWEECTVDPVHGLVTVEEAVIMGGVAGGSILLSPTYVKPILIARTLERECGSLIR